VPQLETSAAGDREYDELIFWVRRNVGQWVEVRANAIRGRGQSRCALPIANIYSNDELVCGRAKAVSRLQAAEIRWPTPYRAGSETNADPAPTWLIVRLHMLHSW